MKKIIQVLFFAFFTISLTQAQTTIKPIWTTGHVGNGAVYSPDNSKILTWNTVGASVWNAQDGKLMFVLSSSIGNFIKAKFSIDGKKIIMYGLTWVSVWSSETGEQEYSTDRTRAEYYIGNIIDADIDSKNENVVLCSQDHLSVVSIASDKVVFALDKLNARSVQFSPSEKLLLLLQDRSARIYNYTTGDVVTDMSYNDLPITSAEFNKKGTHALITVLVEKTELRTKNIQIWEVATGKVIKTFGEKKRVAENATYCYNENKILAYSENGLLQVWNVEDTTLLMSSVLQNYKIRSASINSTNDIVATMGYEDTSVTLRYVNTGEVFHVFKNISTPQTIAFESEKKRLLLSCSNGTANTYDIQQSDVKTVFTMHGNTGLTYAQFHPINKEKIMTYDINGNVNIWSRLSDKPSYTIPHYCEVNQQNLFRYPLKNQIVSFDNTGNMVAYYSKEFKKPILWNIVTNELERSYDQQVGYLNSLAISPNGEYIAFSTDSLNIYSLKTGEKISSGAGGYTSLQFNNSGTKLLASVDIIFAYSALIDFQTGNVSKSFYEANSLVFNPECSTFLNWLMEGRYMKIWDVKTGQLIQTMENVDGITSVLYNKSGSQIVTTTTNSIITWDINTGSKISEIKNDSTRYFGAVTFIDGTKLIAASKNYGGNIDIWDLSAGKTVGKLIGHQRVLTQILVSPDGKNLLTTSEDGTAKLWDISSIVEGSEKIDTNQDVVVTLSPNPTAGNISVQTSSTAQMTFSILNLLGETVQSGLLIKSVTPHTIETSALPSGMYLFVYDINGKAFQQKFIVNR